MNQYCVSSEPLSILERGASCIFSRLPPCLVCIKQITSITGLLENTPRSAFRFRLTPLRKCQWDDTLWWPHPRAPRCTPARPKVQANQQRKQGTLNASSDRDRGGKITRNLALQGWVLWTEIETWTGLGKIGTHTDFCFFPIFIPQPGLKVKSWISRKSLGIWGERTRCGDSGVTNTQAWAQPCMWVNTAQVTNHRSENQGSTEGEDDCLLYSFRLL